MEIKVDEKLKAYLPKLSENERDALTQSLIDDGCQDSIKVWDGKGVIVDGHNRFEICTDHEIEFDVDYYQFNTREDVLSWMDSNQVGRRNLDPTEYKLIWGRRYNEIKKDDSKNLKNGKNPVNPPVGQVDPPGKQKRVSSDLSGESGLSEKTIRRSAERAEVHSSLIDGEEFEAAEKAKTAPQSAIKEAKGKPAKEAAKIIQKPKNGVAEPSAKGLVDSAIKGYISPLIRQVDKIADCNGGQGTNWKEFDKSINSCMSSLRSMAKGNK